MFFFFYSQGDGLSLPTRLVTVDPEQPTECPQPGVLDKGWGAVSSLTIEWQCLGKTNQKEMNSIAVTLCGSFPQYCRRTCWANQPSQWIPKPSVRQRLPRWRRSQRDRCLKVWYVSFLSFFFCSIL